MVSQGAGKDEVLETATEPTTEVVQLRSGGCAGIDEIGWSHTLGKDLSPDELQAKVENFRQKLLENSDVKKVRNAVINCGISKDEQLIALVKRYNFNSPGISFTPDNYYSWTRWRFPNHRN